MTSIEEKRIIRSVARFERTYPRFISIDKVKDLDGTRREVFVTVRHIKKVALLNGFDVERLWYLI